MELETPGPMPPYTIPALEVCTSRSAAIITKRKQTLRAGIHASCVSLPWRPVLVAAWSVGAAGVWARRLSVLRQSCTDWDGIMERKTTINDLPAFLGACPRVAYDVPPTDGSARPSPSPTAPGGLCRRSSRRGRVKKPDWAKGNSGAPRQARHPPNSCPPRLAQGWSGADGQTGFGYWCDTYISSLSSLSLSLGLSRSQSRRNATPPAALACSSGCLAARPRQDWRCDPPVMGGD